MHQDSHTVGVLYIEAEVETELEPLEFLQVFKTPNVCGLLKGTWNRPPLPSSANYLFLPKS